MAHATLINTSFPTILCEHCHETHEVTMELWSFNGVALSRYLAKCQGKPIYGFAH